MNDRVFVLCLIVALYQCIAVLILCCDIPPNTDTNTFPPGLILIRCGISVSKYRYCVLTFPPNIDYGAISVSIEVSILCSDTFPY